MHDDLAKMKAIIEKKDKKQALDYLPKLNSEIMKVAKTGIIKKPTITRFCSSTLKNILIFFGAKKPLKMIAIPKIAVQYTQKLTKRTP